MGTVNPTLTASPGKYIVRWSLPTADIDFTADRLRSERNGDIKASIKIVLTTPDGKVANPHHGNLNLAAGRSRRELSRDLQARVPLAGDLGWDQVIEESCRAILEREEQPSSPGVWLQPVEHTDVRYSIGRVVLEGLPVVLYGPGGSTKSYTSSYMGLVKHNGLDFFGEVTERRNVLLLDWEVNEHEAARRCTLLANGLRQRYIGADIRLPRYKRCLGSIQSETAEIAAEIVEHNIGLVIVDSAGPACGGDAMSGQLAIEFFNSLRTVTTPTNADSLILAHVTKQEVRDENGGYRLPFGSVFFVNMARAAWEVRAEQGGRSNVARVNLHCRKHNMARPEPYGMQLVFEPDAIVVEQAEAHDTSTEQGAIRDMILTELEHGPAGPSELAEAIGTTAGTVSKTLTGMKARGLVRSLRRGEWTRAETPEAEQ
jgi:DNA-binding transcriptional ArsR family regulator